MHTRLAEEAQLLPATSSIFSRYARVGLTQRPAAHHATEHAEAGQPMLMEIIFEMKGL